MSTSIDNRVVAMQFDNKNFEKNVGHTITALDRLEAKLHLKGASKGFDELEKASRRCDLGALGKAAEVIQERFSTMGLVGMNVLNRITNAAITAGQKMVQSFTLAPLKQGYQEYELKMGSIQTIMASTGASIGVVNGYLEELNKYSDQTIYSFADMTQSIGKFTNAGVNLDDAVMAIKGISNEAAVSGANANEASRAMYNFSQALSAGYVKLIDWKSIENANMATREFKQELINTAVALGTLKKTYNGEYRAKRLSITATKNFNDSLQEQWMTSEVLIQTLRRYADANTEIGKKAYAAAQDVKTFSQLIDTLKEAVGSGWAQISEIIIGDLEEAKELWTKVNNVVSKGIDNIFGGVTDFLRNNLSTEYKKFLHDGPIDSIADFDKAMAESREAREEDIRAKIDQNKRIIEENRKLAEYMAQYQRWFKVKNDWKARRDAGLPEWMNAPKGSLLDQNEIIELVKETNHLNSELEDTSFRVSDVRTALTSYLDERLKLTEAERLAKGITEEQYKKLKEFRQGMDDGTISIEQMVSAWNSMSGREMIIDGISNSLKYLGSYLVPIKDAFHEVFFGEGYDPMWLNKLATRFYNFTTTLKASKFSLDNLTSGFKALFSVGKTIVKLFKQLGSSLRKVFDPAISGFKQFGTAMMQVFGNLDWIAEKFDRYVESGELVADITETVTDVMNLLKDAFRSLGEALRIIGPINDLAYELERIQNAIDVGSTTGDWTEFNNILKGYYADIQDYAYKVWNVINSMSFAELLEKIQLKISEYYGRIVEYAGKVSDAFDKFSTDMQVEHGIDVSKIPIIVVLGTFAYLLISVISSLSRVTKGIGKVIEGFTKIQKAIKGVIDSVSKYFKSKAMVNNAIAFKQAAIGVFILAGATAVLAGAMWIISNIPKEKVLDGVKTILEVVTILGLLAVAVSKFGGKEGGIAIIAAAGSLLLMIAAVKLIEKIDVSNITIDKLAAMGGVIIALGGVLFAMWAISKYYKSMSKAAGTLLLGIFTLVAMVSALHLLAKLEFNPDSLLNLFVNVTLAFVALGQLMRILSKAGEHSLKGGIGLFTMVTSLLIMVPAFMALSAVPLDIIMRATKTILLMAIPLSALMLITRLAGENSHKAGVAILAMTFALIPLAGAIYMLGSIPTETLWNGVGAVSVIISMFSLLVAATSLIKAGYRTLLGLAAVVAVLGVVIGLLAMLPADKVLASGESIGLVMASFAAVIAAITFIPKTQIAIGIGILASLGVLAAGLALIISQLAEIPNPDVALQNSIILESLLLELGVLSAILGALGTAGPIILIGAGLMALFVTIAELGALIVWHLSAMENVETARANAITLGALLGELTIISLILTAVGAAGPAALVGLGVLTELLLGMSGVLAIISKFDSDGKTMEKMLAKVPILTELVNSIGRIVASFYTGVSETIIDSVASSSEKLYTIMDNIVHSFDPLDELPENIVPKTLEVLEAIAMLAGAEGITLLSTFIDSVFNKTNNFKSKITGDTEDATVLVKYVGDFADAIKVLSEKADNIDYQKLIKLKSLAEIGDMLADISTSIAREGGILSLWIGKRPDIKTFAEGMGEYIDAISGISTDNVKIDPDKISDVVAAGNELAGMAKTIPNEGGLLGWIVGNNDAGDFASDFSIFAYYMSNISERTGNIEISKFKALRAAGEELASFGKIIPNTGGLWGLIVGNNDADDFGSAFATFAQKLRVIQLNIDGKLSSSTFDGMIAASSDLVHIANLISNADTSHFASFATALDGYNEWLSGFDDDDAIDADHIAANVATGLDAAVKAINSYGGEFESGGSGLMEQFSTAITNQYENVYSIGGEIVKKLASGMQSFRWMITNKSALIALDALDGIKGTPDKAKTYGLSFTKGFANGIKENEFLSRLWAAAVAKHALEQLDKMYDKTYPKGQGFVNGFLDGIILKEPDSTSAAETIATNALSKFDDLYDVMYPKGQGFTNGFGDGISVKEPSSTDAAATVRENADDKLDGVYDTSYSSGEDFGQGYADGISSMESAVEDAADGIGQVATKALNAAQDSHSPSKITNKSGVWFGQGYVDGILSMGESVSKSAAGLGTKSVDAISEAIAGIKTIIDQDVDISPTIRPVVDMTDVDQGFKAISAKYNSNQVSVVAKGKIAADDAHDIELLGSKSTPQTTNMTFTQNNYSPKALSRIDIYRNTRNQFSAFKESVDTTK